jgi:chitinase
MSDSKGYIRQKQVADKKQALTGKLAYWTPCMSEKTRKETGCPGGNFTLVVGIFWIGLTQIVGYHDILVGHGKTFDSDAFEQSTGCHGKDNRILCLNNEVVPKNCNWNRNTDGVRSSCAFVYFRDIPKADIFLEQSLR